MLHRGFLEEVAGLLENGMVQPDSQAGLAIGYRQVIEYLTRPEPQEHDVDALKAFLRRFGTASRNYARSQVQWFLRDPSFVWIPANPSDPQAVASEIAGRLALPAEAFREVAAQDVAIREAQVAQGCAMTGFVSSLEQIQEMEVNLDALVQRADACTMRVPEKLRKGVDAKPILLGIETNSAIPYGKVYWNGRHRKWGWGAPLGKLHKQGLHFAESCGWQCIKEDDDSAVPVFCWPARKACNFPALVNEGDLAPLIRPFPQDFTQRLDDKAQLAAHLAAAGHSDVHPPTWTADDFLRSAPHADEKHEMWFLKHSQGVKGNSVYIFKGAAAVESRLVELGEKGRRCFVVQRGVAPPSLRNGRRWVLRVHTVLRGFADGGVAAYCHRDMVCLEYGQVYTPDIHVRAAHISSAGHQKYWPKPYLLEDEDLAKQVLQLVAKSFAAVWPHIPRGPYTPSGSEWWQVFGADIIVDENGRAWLLEINDFPAIASGTMEHVDSGVYTALVRDMMRLVVLPRTDGLPETLGGFICLDMEGLDCASVLSAVAPDLM